MNKYKCLIVDDEELARELIQAHLSQLNDFELIATCSSAIEANKILKDQSVDLLFLDIEMPVLKGTDFYKNLNNKPQVIFTSAYRDYALDGFDLDAVDYLLKPIVFARFFKAIEKFLLTKQPLLNAVTETPNVTDEYLFIRENRKQVKIMLNSILYVRSQKDYIEIHISNRVHIAKQSISSFKKVLGNGFLRVHRSYIVNIHKITALTKHDIEIGKIEIPIGKQYKAEISKKLNI